MTLTCPNTNVSTEGVGMALAMTPTCLNTNESTEGVGMAMTLLTQTM